MHGKIVLVTGASRGVGLVAAVELAARGASLVLVCRDERRGEAARAEVAGAATGAPPTLLLADLASQASVHRLAGEVRTSFPRVDVLLNNAGGIFARRELTEDGIERTLATNHLAPFLLTHLLLDRLKASAAGRVVTVASESHSGSLDLGNLQGERRYNFFGAYNRSKLANILFTYELARRLIGTGVTSNCVSPGPTATHFADDLRGWPALLPWILKRIPFLLAEPSKGAGPLVFAASSPSLDGVTGRFFLRRKERRSRRITYDLRAAADLWKISEDLTSVRESISAA